ncbi:MAG: hypothetical protein M5U27_13595 [Gaiella sp.]|nr:hypothetical protein [Gaiella sp.]
MRIATKLAKLEFRIGSIQRDGDELIIRSHPDQAMKAQARLGLDDVADLVRASLNRDVLGYLLALPVLLLRRRRERDILETGVPQARGAEGLRQEGSHA